MGNEVKNSNLEAVDLAGLLDGQVSDAGAAQRMYSQIQANPAIKAEYDELRRVKSALALLESDSTQVCELPDFFATRVLGEISARKSRQRARRPLKVALGSFFGLALVASGTGGMIAMHNGAELRQQQLAESFLPRGLFESTDDLYDSVKARDLSIPSGQVDPSVAQFLRVASDAHVYRKALMNSGGTALPDMSGAVLALDSVGEDEDARDERGVEREPQRGYFVSDEGAR